MGPGPSEPKDPGKEVCTIPSGNIIVIKNLNVKNAAAIQLPGRNTSQEKFNSRLISAAMAFIIPAACTTSDTLTAS